MKLPIFQVNAFASRSFTGNSAAVCPLNRWLGDEFLQQIAAENQLTTAFFVGEAGAYELRWFTPQTEIEGICGHGTLAAAFVISTELGDRVWLRASAIKYMQGEISVSETSRDGALDA